MPTLGGISQGVAFACDALVRRGQIIDAEVAEILRFANLARALQYLFYPADCPPVTNREPEK